MTLTHSGVSELSQLMGTGAISNAFIKDLQSLLAACMIVTVVSVA